MEVEKKLGLSLDDLIKQQKDQKKKTVGPKKGGPKGKTGAQTKGAGASKPNTKGAPKALKAAGGVKKTGTTPNGRNPKVLTIPRPKGQNPPSGGGNRGGRRNDRDNTKPTRVGGGRGGGAMQQHGRGGNTRPQQRGGHNNSGGGGQRRSGGGGYNNNNNNQQFTLSGGGGGGGRSGGNYSVNVPLGATFDNLNQALPVSLRPTSGNTNKYGLRLPF